MNQHAFPVLGHYKRTRPSQLPICIHGSSRRSLTSLLFVAALATVALGDSNITNVSPERYELCKSETDIKTLQHKYGLILVSSTPTKAAMHPGWPETLISMVTAFIAVWTATSAWTYIPRFSNDDANGIFGAIFPVVLSVIISCAWVVSFVFIQLAKETGGWLSVLSWMLSLVLIVQASEIRINNPRPLVYWIALLFTGFQLAGSLIVISQRWAGTVGTVAYVISDDNSCNPHNGFAYLEQGARSRAFRIIQTTQLIYSILIRLFIGTLSSYTIRNPDEYIMSQRREWRGAIYLKGEVVKYLIYICLPVIIYDIIIAAMGRPVVISGNCMLVELDPK